MKLLTVPPWEVHDEEEEEEDYKFSRALEGNYKAKINIVVQSHTFFSHEQIEGESVDQYIAVLRTLASTCRFRELREEIIRDQLVNKTSNTKIQEKLLNMKEPSLEKAIIMAKRVENTTQYVK